jgi:hypothetical protein
VSGGQYVAAAYGVFLVFVLAYVAIIAAKLGRLQRDTDALTEASRDREYAAPVPEARARAEEPE